MCSSTPSGPRAGPQRAAVRELRFSAGSGWSSRGTSSLIVGTDLDLTVKVEMEAIGLDDGACVTPARLSTDIVRSLEPGAVTVEANDNEVEISAGRSRFVVRTYPLEDFPTSPSEVSKPRSTSRLKAWPRRCVRS